jgi:hypothetical protein
MDIGSRSPNNLNKKSNQKSKGSGVGNPKNRVKKGGRKVEKSTEGPKTKGPIAPPRANIETSSNVKRKINNFKKKRIKKRKLKFNLTFQNYMKDINKITKGKLTKQQKVIIKDKIINGNYKKLSAEDSALHRKTFALKKKKIIKEWEKNTAPKWPTYDEPVIYKGETVRPKGALYDAHHVIESSWGGDNEWWNMVPAKYLSEHQNGIHREGGYANVIFD